MPYAMYTDTLKYFLEVIGEKAIGHRHILRVVTIFLDIRLRLFAYKFFLR